jgi:hypothetical protein
MKSRDPLATLQSLYDAECAETQRLREQLAERFADSARMDWLEAHRSAGVGASGPMRTACLYPTREDFRYQQWEGATVRAAIDEAMKSK